MGIQTGFWIDHRKAVIMAVTDQGETVQQIISEVEKQLRRSGASSLKGSFEGRHIPADDSQEGKYTGHLNMCYDAVVASLRNTEGILIFGSGEAKVHAYFHGGRHTASAIRTKRPGGVLETHRPALPGREKIEENDSRASE